jgi:putative two-component system response regulator
LRELPSREPTYVIMLTSKNGTEAAIAALEGGADDYIEKPFERELLRARLRVGRRIVGLQTSETIVYSFARSVEAKSPYTRGHSERVSRYVLALAAHMNLNAGDRDVLRRGAVLHDIGKICVPDHILNKPGPLTPEEFATISEHPLQGVKMIESLDSVKDVIPLVRSHHERIDGKGYPDKLKGDEIPLLVRILSVADVYDALSSDRPYRPGLAHAECATILRRNAAEGGLDAKLVEAFCKLNPASLPELASVLTQSKEHAALPSVV